MRRTGAGLCPCDGAVVFCGWPGGVAALLSCCPVVVADVSVISCCRVFTWFCVVAEPSRRIRKLALLSSGGAAACLFPRAALAVILLLWLFFGCIDGHTEIVTLPVIGFVRLRGCVLFLFFRRLPQDIAINPVTTPCQKISATATMARKAVALPRLRFFSLLTAGCTGSFSSSSCALRSSASLLRGLPAQAWQYHPQRVPGMPALHPAQALCFRRSSACFLL